MNGVDKSHNLSTQRSSFPVGLLQHTSISLDNTSRVFEKNMMYSICTHLCSVELVLDNAPTSTYRIRGHLNGDFTPQDYASRAGHAEGLFVVSSYRPPPVSRLDECHTQMVQ